MATIEGRIAGQVHITYDDDRNFRTAVDKLLTNGVRFIADVEALRITIDLGRKPGVEAKSTDYARWREIDGVLDQINR